MSLYIFVSNRGEHGRHSYSQANENDEDLQLALKLSLEEQKPRETPRDNVSYLPASR